MGGPSSSEKQQQTAKPPPDKMSNGSLLAEAGAGSNGNDFGEDNNNDNASNGATPKRPMQKSAYSRRSKSIIFHNSLFTAPKISFQHVRCHIFSCGNFPLPENGKYRETQFFTGMTIEMDGREIFQPPPSFSFVSMPKLDLQIRLFCSRGGGNVSIYQDQTPSHIFLPLIFPLKPCTTTFQ